jgi:hypothetical protein
VTNHPLPGLYKDFQNPQKILTVKMAAVMNGKIFENPQHYIQHVPER